jgi:hypothetical protein
MVGAWSARVLVLIVELIEFRLVAETNTGAANKSLRATLLVDRLPPEPKGLSWKPLPQTAGRASAPSRWTAPKAKSPLPSVERRLRDYRKGVNGRYFES